MGSRLAELQARYKQKQLQEMENKLKKLIPNAEQKTISLQVTKTVTAERRSMEERKPKAGIDRSYPLKPLKVTTTRTTQSMNTTKNINTKAPILKTNITVTKQVVEDARNCGNENLIDNTKAPIIKSNITVTEEVAEDTANYENVSDNKIDDLNYKGSLNNKLKSLNISNKNNEKPLLTKRVLPQPVLNKSLKGVNEKPQLSYQLSTGNTQKKEKLDTKKPVGNTTNMSSRGRNQPRAPVANRPSAKQNPRGPSAITRDDLAACKFCNRRFAPDRLQIHEDICGRTGKKKRKTYDALKHRVQGTELEPFVKKGGRASSRARTPSARRSNWRQTHNEFISTIRTAKMTQAHIAKGGKLADLPPPPPSSNPDYVQCPHCGRRFNQTAAERHIPKCATYDFNKPRTGAPARAPSKPLPLSLIHI